MKRQLHFIKVMHTLIWAILSALIFYILYSGLFDVVNHLTFVALGLVVMEVVVLIIYHWSCPLTGLARKYSDSEKENFDIYLPEWLAKHNKIIFGTLFVLGLILVTYRLIN